MRYVARPITQETTRANPDKASIYPTLLADHGLGNTIVLILGAFPFHMSSTFDNYHANLNSH